MFLVIVVTGTAPALPTGLEIMDWRCAMVAPLRALAVEVLSPAEEGFCVDSDGVEIARGRLDDMAPLAAASDLSPCVVVVGAASALRIDRLLLVLKACVAAEFPCERSLLRSVELRLALKA